MIDFFEVLLSWLNESNQVYLLHKQNLKFHFSDFLYFLLFNRGQVDDGLKTSMKTFYSEQRYPYWGRVNVARLSLRSRLNLS